MPQAIAGAVVGAIGLTGTVAAIASFAVQMAVSYALTSLTTKKSSSGSLSNEERTAELTGGTSEERVIYGRAKVSGTRYMLQKYNGFIYHGIAICRHPCEEIEAIYFDDKLSTDSDFSDVELATYSVSLSTGGGTYETKELLFSSGTVTATEDITLVVEGITYTYSAAIGETNEDVRDGLYDLLNGTSEISYSKTSDAPDYGIQIRRTSGGIDNFSIVSSFSDGGTGLTVALSTTVGGSLAGADTAGTATLTIDGTDYAYDFAEDEVAEDITAGLFALLTDDEEFNYVQYAGATIYITRISGSVAEWDISVSCDTGASTGVTNTVSLVSGHAETESKHRIIYELGNQTTANADLVSELDFGDVTHRWTDDHKLTGVTHINVRWKSSFLRDTYGRLPAITVVLKGKNNIYDPRDETYKYTTNAALCARDWLTQPYGFDATSDELDETKWIAAANVCDEDVVIDELDQTQKRYAVNTVLTTETQPADVLTIFSQAMQAPIGWQGGGWHLKPAKYEIPEIEITLDDLAGNIQYTNKPSIGDRYNSMQGTFINPLQVWSSHDYPSIIVEDGLSTKTGELNLTTEIDYIRAQRIAQLHLLLNYASAATQIHIKRLNTYIPVDSMIYLTVPQLNWNNKTFYVSNRVDNEDTTATLTLLPRQPEMFEWDYTQAQEVDTITSEPIFDIREELK